MRRRSKRNQVPADETKTDSPKRATRQSSRRRKRSSSRSSNEPEPHNEEVVQNQVDLRVDQVDPQTNDSGNNSLNDSENITDSQMESDKIEIEKNVVEEEKEDKEEGIKGKSTGINNMNDQSTNNIEHEIENENVQGSPPSPKDNDENIQNINETKLTNDDENQDNTLTHDTKNTEEIDPKPNNNHKDTFISEYANDEPKNNFPNGEIKHDQNKSVPEEKSDNMEKEQPEKKKITLRRSASEKITRPTSPLEDGEIQEPKGKSRKITLKRRTTEDSNSDFDKIVINRRSSVGVENSEKRKRLASASEENILTVVGKPIKSPKIVKLVRNFPQESSQDPEPQRIRKLWGKSEFLENLNVSTFKIDVDSIKTVCPSVEFLKESEVKLEEEPVHSENETDKKAEEEATNKSDEESEKEHSDEGDSSEDQKIEANPNIIALNRKISIVEDTAAKMRPPPSPAKNPSSEILYITNLVRPFTIKQLRELLERTGKMRENGFWTDRIKSKCYAYYETIEEAETTRNALHGVFWPIGNGKQLVIDYATEEDMEGARNPVPVAVVPEKLPGKENREPDLDERHKERAGDRNLDREEKRREPSGREWDKTKEEHRRKHSRSRSRERARKHSRRSYTPEDNGRKKHKNSDDLMPQKLMDDLFLKTKAMPSIYWQPLSPQEIATKQQQRLVRMEEHKRRVEETRGRRERERRTSFRRR